MINILDNHNSYSEEDSPHIKGPLPSFSRSNDESSTHLQEYRYSQGHQSKPADDLNVNGIPSESPIEKQPKLVIAVNQSISEQNKGHSESSEGYRKPPIEDPTSCKRKHRQNTFR